MSDKPRYTLKEYETIKNISISSSSVSTIQERFSRVLTTSLTGENKCSLTAHSYIGKIELPDMVIEISPKVPVPMVLQWITVANDLQSLSWEQEHTSYSNGLGDLEWIVKCFIHECKLIYTKGLRKGYIQNREIIGTVNGQWKPNTTFTLWLKNDYRFDCEFDEFTTWIIENQYIYAALYDMKQEKYHDTNIYRDLSALLSVFGAETHDKWLSNRISVEEKLEMLTKIPITRLNIHYQKAFNWLMLYWKGITLSFKHGNIYAQSFVLDMNELFELYISRRLQKSLRDDHIDVILQKQDWLAEGGRIKIKPDIILRNRIGKQIIIDTKYKVRKDDRSVNENVFQMLAYMTAIKVDSGILLYAIGPERVDKIRHTEKTIYQMSVMSGKKLDIEYSIEDDFEVKFKRLIDRINKILLY